MLKNQLLKSVTYWVTKLQEQMFREVQEYLKTQGMNQSELAEQMGVTKGYVSQVLNGNFDFRLSKYVELCLAIDKVPQVDMQSLSKLLEDRSALASRIQADDFPVNQTNARVVRLQYNTVKYDTVKDDTQSDDKISLTPSPYYKSVQILQPKHSVQPYNFN